MSKIALIGDLHAGVRNDNVAIRNRHLNYLRNTFIPYLIDNKIDTVIQVGDIFDRRKYTNHLTLYTWKREFFDILQQNNITMHTILGNHDVFFKNTLEIDAIDLMLQQYGNIICHRIAEDVVIHDTSFLFIPWICADNQTAIMEQVKVAKSDIVIAHLELAGFEMQRGQLATHGMDGRLFENFEVVFTGHYHHKSKIGNVHYLGTPYEITWADYDDARGFYIFDTETRTTEFIQNTDFMFHKIIYNDTNQDLSNYAKMDLTMYKDTYVKLIVQSKSNAYLFDIFIERLEKNGVIDLQIVEERFNINLADGGEILSQAEDTITILNKYVDQLDVKNRDMLKLFFKAVHQEAVNKE